MEDFSEPCGDAATEPVSRGHLKGLPRDTDKRTCRAFANTHFRRDAKQFCEEDEFHSCDDDDDVLPREGEHSDAPGVVDSPQNIVGRRETHDQSLAADSSRAIDSVEEDRVDGVRINRDVCCRDHKSTGTDRPWQTGCKSLLGNSMADAESTTGSHSIDSCILSAGLDAASALGFVSNVSNRCGSRGYTVIAKTNEMKDSDTLGAKTTEMEDSDTLGAKTTEMKDSDTLGADASQMKASDFSCNLASSPVVSTTNKSRSSFADTDLINRSRDNEPTSSKFYSVQASCSSDKEFKPVLPVSQCFLIGANSGSSSPNSPGESPGIFFSCYTSLSDIRDDPTSPGQTNTQTYSPQITEARSHLRVTRDIDLCSDVTAQSDAPPCHQPSQANERHREASGFQRPRHSSRRKEKSSRNNNLVLEPKVTSVYKLTKGCLPASNPATGPACKDTTANSGTRGSSSSNLSSRRDAHKSLTPLTIFQPSPTRRAKSASPVPSRIPRPVMRERAVTRAPSGPALHSAKPRAMAARSVSVCSERDSQFRKWAKVQSFQKSSCDADSPARSKFISGRGGTAWTLPATTGHTNKATASSGLELEGSSTYTRNTFSSTCKRRHKERAPVFPRPIPDSRKSTRYVNRPKTLQVANSCHFPTPPSSRPAHSPVSLPSVGSSPIVLLNCHIDENCFFPKTPTPSNSQGNQAGCLKADKESENHALKISSYVQDPSSDSTHLATFNSLVIGSSQERSTTDTRLVPKTQDVETCAPLRHLAGTEQGTGKPASSGRVASTAALVPDDVRSLHCSTDDVHSLHCSTDDVQPYSLDYVASNQTQPLYLDSVDARFQTISLDSLIANETGNYLPSAECLPPNDGFYPCHGDFKHDYQLNQCHGDSTYGFDGLHQVEGNSSTYDNELHQCRGDSTYGSLPYTIDSLMDYPSSASSLPLSYVSTCLGKEEELNPVVDSHHSESEDSWEDYTWIHMTGGAVVSAHTPTLSHQSIHKVGVENSVGRGYWEWLLQWYSKKYGV
ncbi:hypothetical protein ElyMa_006171600 [Elysia marginata]|uniref:Uncharacterized protein n=1 Tax=Elysia marginata TaxID=1093978 RepID=A0AAV4GZE9_9GAST|nr:hypothetical protein ElyMa_006171600 [Elysia marginata]